MERKRITKPKEISIVTTRFKSLKELGKCVERYKAYQCNHPRKSNYNGTGQANIVEKNNVIAGEVVKVSMMENKVDWILDTGASRHFCNNKAIITDFEDARVGNHVYIGNSSPERVLDNNVEPSQIRPHMMQV